MSNLPSRFLRLTAKNKLVRQFEILRTDRRERQIQGHVLVQGLKTIQELAAKGHRIRTVGITFDDNLPIGEPALSIVKHWAKHEEKDQKDAEEKKEIFKASQFVAVSRAMTTRILGTDSKTSEHEVWAEVQIPDHQALFSPSYTQGKDIRRLLILDQITDPGNMGLMVRAGMAMGWGGVWSTPGTVDLYNDKVVRASRAHCLEWPNHLGGWVDLASFLEQRKMSLVVADMLPSITPASPQGRSDSTVESRKGQIWDQEQKAKAYLLKNAIRVSIPMHPAVESMNVATAATIMMWELNSEKSPKLQVLGF
ncbi:hypothetical protein BGZ82_008216 [Podila clonocystis]|nr:hypothetical protein BGZ82_008216 [Podila clonocystis]